MTTFLRITSIPKIVLAAVSMWPVSSFVNSSSLTISMLVLMLTEWTFLYVWMTETHYLLSISSVICFNIMLKNIENNVVVIKQHCLITLVIGEVMNKPLSHLNNPSCYLWISTWWAIQLFQDYLEAWLLLPLSSQKRDIEPFVSSVAFFFYLSVKNMLLMTWLTKTSQGNNSWQSDLFQCCIFSFFVWLLQFLLVWLLLLIAILWCC